MAIGRIRTADESLEAAWDFRGVNYVGFTTLPKDHERSSRDQMCLECTTADRTPADLRTNANNELWWPEDEDEDDLEWMPADHDKSDVEPLEYDSQTSTSSRRSSRNSSNASTDGGGDDSTVHSRCSSHDAYPLLDMYSPPCPLNMPRGIWKDGFIFYRWSDGTLRRQYYRSAFGGRLTAPPEHIASPSCQSLQGINGNVLSVVEMKNCRNGRFVVPKTTHWRPEPTDDLFETDSLFFLSGESNGSESGFAWPLYPPRHGLRKVSGYGWKYNTSNDGYEMPDPVPVHSYCLDVFAKASYSQFGRVDMNDLWHWREMQDHPETYGLVSTDVLPPRAEVARAREKEDYPWCHIPGDEWLVANPVEVPGLDDALESCQSHGPIVERPHQPQCQLLALPAELVQATLFWLDSEDVNAVAATCYTMYHHTRPIFRLRVLQEMPWLWEMLEESTYPSSFDWPVAWDPLCPPGLTPPSLPPDLPSEEVEHDLWAEIVEDDPDLIETSKVAMAVSRMRREAIFAPVRAAEEATLREWQEHRRLVKEWICGSSTRQSALTDCVDWVRVWRLARPDRTKFLGVRNRACIWNCCEEILNLIERASEIGTMEEQRDALRRKVSFGGEWYDSIAQRFGPHVEL